MALNFQIKEKIVKKFSLKNKDTGSCEVQIALLSENIKSLKEHFLKHKKDYHGQRGLLSMVAHRRKLLFYLKRENITRYNKLIQLLNIRR